MIMTRHSRTTHALFDLAFLPWMRRRLNGPLIAGAPRHVPEGIPLLLVANHCSWWDGFLLRELQRRVRPGARLYTVMLESELRGRPFFRWMGVIGLEPKSRASLRTLLRFAHTHRTAPEGVVLSFFPQGRIQASTARPLEFQTGVRAVARRLAPVAILPVAIHFEMLNRPAPSAFLSCATMRRSEDGFLDVERLADVVARELDAIRQFVALHGEDVFRAWPGVDRHQAKLSCVLPGPR